MGNGYCSSFFYYLFSNDTDGHIIWENTYGNTGDNAFNMMKKVPEVGYIAIGTSSSFFSKISKVIIGKSKVDDDILDELEEVLILILKEYKTYLKIS